MRATRLSKLIPLAKINEILNEAVEHNTLGHPAFLIHRESRLVGYNLHTKVMSINQPIDDIHSTVSIDVAMYTSSVGVIKHKLFMSGVSSCNNEQILVEALNLDKKIRNRPILLVHIDRINDLGLYGTLYDSNKDINQVILELDKKLN